jgi:transcriptional regulator with XRE-family HTH domain
LPEWQPLFFFLLASVLVLDYHKIGNDSVCLQTESAEQVLPKRTIRKRIGAVRRWIDFMNNLFADVLRKMRMKKGLNQLQLANLMFVNKATVSKWESGKRLPDAAMITRLARVLEVDVGALLSSAVDSDESYNIIIVDDNNAILSDSLSVLSEAVPDATITGFNWPHEAIENAKVNRIDLAFLDIEMGTASGLDLCHALLEINPCTRVVYLTAYPEYSLKAWDTEAAGFMVKPLTPEDVCRQLKKLRCPFSMGGGE